VLRPIKITRNYLDFAEGSALIEWGKTRVLCAASVQEGVPTFLNKTGKGWLTAEYAMLPKSCKERVNRGPTGRSQEIQRLIGRSLRAIVDLTKIGERTIRIDCDVIQADGGTRTASVTGAVVALHDALSLLKETSLIKEWPLECLLSAVSVGIVDGKAVLDMDYREDSSAEVDFNVVMTEKGDFIEIQGTGEETTFSQEQLDMLLDNAKQGIQTLTGIQKKALGLE